MGDIVLALIQFGERLLYWFLPWTVIPPENRGYRIWCGDRDTAKFLEPGFHWHWMFAFHTIEQYPYYWATTNMNVQSLTTANGVHVQVAGILKHRIKKGDVYLWDIESDEEYLEDIAYGALADAITKSHWPMEHDSVPRVIKHVIDELRKEDAFSIKSFRLADRQEGRSIRLFQEKLRAP